ncbi:MAG: phospholipase D-like domain-containing protein [Ferroplasma sp.]
MSYQFYIEPRDGVKPIIKMIKKSRKFLYINSYLLDDQNVLSAVTDAAKRKLDVRIIVDGRPYGINGDDGTHDEIDVLKKTGAKVKIAPMRFERPNVFDHAKYIVSGNYAELGTPNFTEAAFTKNREYFTITTDNHVIKSLRTIFLADFENKKAGSAPRKFLIVSPEAKAQLVDFMSKEKKLLIETEEMGDEPAIIKLLSEKGRHVKLIVPTSISSTDAASIEKLKKAGVRVRYMPATLLYMHAKMIAGKKVFIGSENFTKSSLIDNRETGILISGFFKVPQFKDSFKHDWRIASKNLKIKRSGIMHLHSKPEKQAK